MPIRFDDSLPALSLVIMEQLGPDMLERGVVLRDASGRLAFFAPDPLDPATIERVAQHLRETLGSYARFDRVVADCNDFGASTVLCDATALPVLIGASRTRLLDRRMVGADWLRAPAPMSAQPRRFVFASLKGGVGRSTGLAVAAVALASRGLRVLAIDLDMEAPGLGPMLLDPGTLPEFGILDALVENGLSGLDNALLADLVGPSALAGGRGRIDVIPVLGRRSLENPADVLAKIARAYIEDIGPDGAVATLRDQIATLLDRLSDGSRYDAILVDARAGLHETTASSLLGLGAEVLLFGLDEPQTFQGFRVLLAHLARFGDPAEPAPEWLSRINLVQGKAPPETHLRQAFAERCRDLAVEVGLGPRAAPVAPLVTPTEPFSDIPWDDEATDESVLFEEDWTLRDPIAILDDSRFRGFDPLARRDLLESQIYETTFGSLLDLIDQCLANDLETRA